MLSAETSNDDGLACRQPLQPTGSFGSCCGKGCRKGCVREGRHDAVSVMGTIFELKTQREHGKTGKARQILGLSWGGVVWEGVCEWVWRGGLCIAV